MFDINFYMSAYSLQKRINQKQRLSKKDVIEKLESFRDKNPFVYNIETTAEYEGPIEIEIDYGDEAFENEEGLSMLHYEDGEWLNVTKTLDTENNIIKGEVQSLSPFVIVEDSEPPVLFGVPADITVECSTDVPENPEVTATDNVAGNVAVGVVFKPTALA